MIKPRDVPRSGEKNFVIALLAGLLALSLGISASLLYFFWPRRSNNTANNNQIAVTNTNRPAETPTPTPQASPTIAATPTSTPRPSRTPADPSEDAGTDPGPTRISFAAGRTSATVEGEVWRQRTYLLSASAGQELEARLNSSDDCASFSRGARSVRFPTESGNNALIVFNDCDDGRASFTLTVSIR